jgi:hypothetical protein
MYNAPIHTPLDIYKDAVEHLLLAKATAATAREGGGEGGGEGASEASTLPCLSPFALMSCCHETGKWSMAAGAASMVADITERIAQGHSQGQGQGQGQGQSPRPLRVIGAVGGIRKGKSYFLNRVAGRQSGFGVGDDATPTCTEGIWVWFLPDMHTVLLDTAG